jgi:hypothetical protein
MICETAVKHTRCLFEWRFRSEQREIYVRKHASDQEQRLAARNSPTGFGWIAGRVIFVPEICQLFSKTAWGIGRTLHL